MTLRILMFGHSGQVATEMRRRAGPDVSIEALSRDQADLSDPDACATAIAARTADVVVNAAAYTAVDKAEEEEELAQKINGEAPGAMARACAGQGIPFLHVSTDYVFDGKAMVPYAEDDPVSPAGAYGRSKLAGEMAVRQADGPHVILRTAWVFAGHGKNFVRTMLTVGATRPELTVVDDQKGGPTWAGDIADALLSIAKAHGSGAGTIGTYHFCGAPEVTWCGFAREIFRQSGWQTVPEVKPIRTEDWPTPAKRPANSVLDCSKITRDYGLAQPDWRMSLSEALQELKETDR